MEHNGLEADEPLVKTQITVIKKEQNTENPTKNKTTKPENKLQKQYPMKPTRMINAVTAKRQVI